MNKIFTPLSVVAWLCLMLATQFAFAQSVGINANGAAPDPSAALDVSATNKGILIPRMTQNQRDDILAPTEGLLIYNTDSAEFQYYSSTAFGVPSWGSISKPPVKRVV